MSKTAATHLILYRTVAATVLCAWCAAQQPLVRGLGDRARWCIDDRGGVSAVEVYDRAKRVLTHVPVGLRIEPENAGNKSPRVVSSWEIPTGILVHHGGVSGSDSKIRWLALEPEWPRVLAIEMRASIGRVVTLEGAATTREPNVLHRAGAPHVVVRARGAHVEDGRFVIDEARAWIFVTFDADADAARLRLARLRHGATEFLDRARTRAAIWRAGIDARLGRDDALLASFEVAIWQLRAHVRSFGETCVVRNWTNDGPRGARRGRSVELDPWGELEVRRALVDFGLSVGLPNEFAVAEPPGRARPFLDPLAWGRSEAVLPLDTVVRQVLARGIDAEGWSEQLRAALGAKRVPMLLDPRDDRAVVSLMLLNTPLRPVQDFEDAIADCQARCLLELLRADGTLGWMGRLRPGARPGPVLATSPLGTAWLAEARLASGDVSGARRALESLDRVRRSVPGRLFPFAYGGDAGASRPRDARAAAAFLTAVQRLVEAEKRTSSPPGDIVLPKLLYRYANQEPGYRIAFARCAAWCRHISPSFTSRRVTVRKLSTVLAEDEITAEISRLQAISAWVEAQFEASRAR